MQMLVGRPPRRKEKEKKAVLVSSSASSSSSKSIVIKKIGKQMIPCRICEAKRDDCDPAILILI